MQSLSDSAQVFERADARANLVVFGGLRAEGGYGVPAFEFVRTLSELRYNVLFVRDLSQRWYNYGLEGFSETMDGTAERIAEVIKQRFPPLALGMLGNSMGGYGALYFGEMLGARQVVAIVPQTFIGSEMRERLGENRWCEQLNSFAPNVRDLRPHLKGRIGRIDLVTGNRPYQDLLHIGNICGLPNVNLSIIDAKHNVCRLWQEQGVLSAKIDGIFTEGMRLST